MRAHRSSHIGGYSHIGRNGYLFFEGVQESALARSAGSFMPAAGSSRSDSWVHSVFTAPAYLHSCGAGTLAPAQGMWEMCTCCHRSKS